MVNKTTINVSAELAERMTDLVGNTLSVTDKDDLYESIFNFWRNTLKGFDSETIEAIAVNMVLTAYDKDSLFKGN